MELLTTEYWDALNELKTLREYSFKSDIPIIGRLIVKFRELWNAISTKWYVRPLIRQQSDFNQLILIAFDGLARYTQGEIAHGIDLDNRVSKLDGHVVDLTHQVIAMDRENTVLRHDVAELSAQLKRTQRLCEDLQDQLQVDQPD